MKKVEVVIEKLFYFMLIVIICLFIIIYTLFLICINPLDIDDIEIKGFIFFITESEYFYRDPSMLGEKISLLSSNPSKDLNILGSSSSSNDLTQLGSNLGRPLMPIPETPQDNIPESTLTKVEGIRSRNEFWFTRDRLTNRFIIEYIEGFKINPANELQGKENADFWTKSRTNDIAKVNRILNQSGINVAVEMPDSLDNYRVIETYRIKYYVIKDNYFSEKDFSLLKKCLKDFEFKEELFHKNYDIGIKQSIGTGSITRKLLGEFLGDNVKLDLEMSGLIRKSPIYNPHSVSYLINR